MHVASLTSRCFFPFCLGAVALAAASVSHGETVLVEAESFEKAGGWQMDTQFIDIMGSPYLLAHGLGKPVADAETTVTFPSAGTYRVWVRTKDWVAHWGASGTPGRFQIGVDGTLLPTEFGTKGADWHWQEGGSITVAGTSVRLRLHDLTGFDGRCDAVIFSNDPGFEPDNSSEVLAGWRRKALGLGEGVAKEGPYDVVFIGGGYVGACGAISAARMGLKTALIQNRGVLGGNGSSEVRVWAMGNTPPGLYPLGDIIREFEDSAKASPGTYEEFEDAKKETIVRAEKNLDLFLNHHAFHVTTEKNLITGVDAFDTRTGAVRRFQSRTYCDATGHGTVAMMAGADLSRIEGGRMGMSNMWTWGDTDAPAAFPETPWALDLAEGDFPYPKKYHAEWFWESGFNKDPLADLETIRDWNLRANFGAWNAIKNKGAYARYDTTGKNHGQAALTWMAYIGGPRETQQVLGDIILTEDDIVNRKPYDDGCVLSTWSIDLHYPVEEYAKKFPENPFISKAVHGKGVDRKKGYPVPYRCFYSRNIGNLFVAGRNISVTHEALGTIRVMKTCGMMGVVVGKAAAVCAKHQCLPRDVYYEHLPELIELMRLPGNQRRDTVGAPFREDPSLPKPEVEESGYVSKASLGGIVIDDKEATYTGSWTEGAGLPNYVEDGYHYAPPGKGASARYQFSVPRDGDYEVRVSIQPHENRSSRTPITVGAADGEKTVTVNQRIAPPLAKGFATLGVYRFEAGTPGSVTIGSDGADGNVHADAVQVLPLK